VLRCFVFHAQTVTRLNGLRNNNRNALLRRDVTFCKDAL
jgi:hypothetical protein